MVKKAKKRKKSKKSDKSKLKKKRQRKFLNLLRKKVLRPNQKMCETKIMEEK